MKFASPRLTAVYLSFFLPMPAFAASAQIDCTHSLTGSTISATLSDLSNITPSTVHIYGNGHEFEIKEIRMELTDKRPGNDERSQFS
jgi:hypothetical protein